jgi:hypothetical protein
MIRTEVVAARPLWALGFCGQQPGRKGEERIAAWPAPVALYGA